MLVFVFEKKETLGFSILLCWLIGELMKEIMVNSWRFFMGRDHGIFLGVYEPATVD